MQRTSLFKRKRNRIPINFLSKRRVSTKRSRTTRKIIELSLPAEHSETLADTGNSWDPNDDHNADEQCHEENNDTDTTINAHTKRKLKLAEKWNVLRNDAYKMMIQCKALPPNQRCFSCDGNNASVRCEQCGPLLMCRKCCMCIHEKIYYHHFPEIWQVYTYCSNFITLHIGSFVVQDNCFVPLNLPPKSIMICSHECTTTYFRKITCFHLGEKVFCIKHFIFLKIQGTPYSVNVQFCKCMSDAIRLIELGYWPATPARPNLAFTQSFMDWMEALLLECQVSVQDFTSAVEMIVKENFTKVSYSLNYFRKQYYG